MIIDVTEPSQLILQTLEYGIVKETTYALSNGDRVIITDGVLFVEDFTNEETYGTSLSFILRWLLKPVSAKDVSEKVEGLKEEEEKCD